jgi:hypothetical protein
MIPFWLKRYYHAAFRFPEADQRRVVPCGSTAKGTDLRPPWMRPGPLYSRMAERRHQHFFGEPRRLGETDGARYPFARFGKHVQFPPHDRTSARPFSRQPFSRHVRMSHFGRWYSGRRTGHCSACREFVEGGLDWFSSMKPISRPSWGQFHEFRLLWQRAFDGSFREFPTRTCCGCGLRRHSPLLSCS